MNIGLLKTFLDVARYRHFGRAAENIFLTQSAVSARIKQLEELLGKSLFTRKRNGVELTAAGRRLALTAAQIIKTWESTLNEINMVNGEDQQLLRLGLNFELWSVILKPWLNQKRAQFPHMLFQVMALSSTLLIERLLADELDAIVVFEPPYQSGIEAREISTLDLILVCDIAVSLQEARTMEYYNIDWGAQISSQHHTLLSDKLTPALYFNYSSLALDYLLDQGGLCYLTAIEAQPYLDSGRLFQVKEAPVFQRQVYYCFRKSNLDAALLMDDPVPA